MKKNVFSIFIVFLLFSCSISKNTVVKKGIYEILVTQNDGGANIKFYEIISEAKEINMLLADPTLRKTVKKEDIATCNYVIINLGPLPDGNYASPIEKVEETETNIVLKIKELKVKPADQDAENTVYPYSVIKINSKKPIVLK